MIHRDMLRASFFGENLIEPDQKEEIQVLPLTLSQITVDRYILIAYSTSHGYHDKSKML